MHTQLEGLKHYFQSGATQSYSFRLLQLKRLKQVVLEHEKELYHALHADLKKSEEESWATEIGFFLNELNYTIDHLKEWMQPNSVPTNLLNQPSSCYTVREPLGVVCIIAPWNYPFQLLFTPMIGAIAGGNCVVLKPSEFAPATAAVMAKICKALFPENYILYVEGEGAQVLPAMFSSFRFDHIFYTGSTTVGRIIYQQAADKLVPVTLELGGKSPAIIEKGCNMQAAAKRVIWGKTVNAGQTCIAPDYVWVHHSEKQSFIDAAKVALEQMYGRDIAQSPDFGRMVNERSFDRVSAYLKGADVVFGGGMDRDKKYIEPTLVAVDGWSSPVMCEEVFGPILPLRTYETLDEVIADVNAHEKPLALYFFGSDAGAEKVLAKTSSGGVSINDTLVHVANQHLPFGGVGGSGYGSYRGKHTFEVFSHKKSVMRSPLWFNVPIKYPPYKGLGLLRWLLG